MSDQDRAALADEIERLARRTSLPPWQPGERGRIISICKGFPSKEVGQKSGQQDALERDANTRLTCLLRSNLPTILGALRAQANREAMQERVERVLTDITRPSAIKLMAGEMTAQEARTVYAVANGIAAKVRSALKPDGGPDA